MTTRPIGVTFIGGGIMVPAPPRSWGNFCSLSDAKTMVANLNAAPAIQALGVTFGAPFVDPEQHLAYLVDDPQQPDQMWATQGTDNQGRLIIVDPLGSFIDRQKYPNPFLDRNPDTSIGGPNIHVLDLGYTVELYWGK